MITKIKPSHSYEEYMECVDDLMGNGIPSEPKDFYNKIVFKNQNREVYVYIIDDKIVATASIVLEYKLRYKTPKVYIEDVGVNPAYRGQGLGKKMVRHCISEARSFDAYKIVLTCTDDLLPFYKELGFDQDVNFMVV